MHPDIHGNSKQSLAEAIVPPDSQTLLHKHMQTEEIYHITEGVGLMTLGDEQFKVTVGDSICIVSNTPQPFISPGIKDVNRYLSALTIFPFR